MIYFSFNYIITLLVIYNIIYFISQFNTIQCEQVNVSLSNAPTYLLNQYHLLEDILLPIVESNAYNLILPINSLGLANRLRTIASIYSILIHKNNLELNNSHNDNNIGGIHLIVIWISSIECPVLFSDLFQSVNLNMITFISLYEEDVLNFNYVMRQLFLPQMQKIYDYKCKEYYYTKFLLTNYSYVEWNEYNINMIWTRGSHSSIDISCKDYLQLKHLFYRNLVPSVQVKQIMIEFPFIPTIVDTMYNKNENNDKHDLIVGIHIRAFDHAYDWAVVHPIQSKIHLTIDPTTNQPSYLHVLTSDDDDDDIPQHASQYHYSRRFDEVQSLDIFIDYMNQIIQLHPTIKFFIASNSMIVKQLIQAQFPVERLYMISSTSTATSTSLLQHADDRSTLKGMIAATAEFLLLGHTSWIAHTMGSSFAREAASIQQIPVIDITMWQYTDTDTVSTTERVTFYSQHILMPYCQMPEYIRDITYQRYNSLSDHNHNTTNTNATNNHEVYIDDVTSTKVLHNIHHTIHTNSATNILDPVCYIDNERQMCTMPYLICSCQDFVVQDNLSLSDYVQIYDGLFCYFDISNLLVSTTTSNTANCTNQNVPINCYLLLAESNGYTL